MGEELSNSAKIAISICVMASLMFIVITLLNISSNFSRAVVNNTVHSVSITYGDDLEAMAASNKPIQVALVYSRCLKLEDAVKDFEIVNSNGATLTTDVSAITQYLSCKAYVDVQESNGYYKLRLRLVT